MKRVCWLTDLHLNFVDTERIVALVEEVHACQADVVLVGGDIAEAHDLPSYLGALDDQLQLPLHFVLGNHDFYRGSIHAVRKSVTDLSDRSSTLNYLSQSSGPIEITPRVGLVGHDGWADGRVGDYDRSTVMLNDYMLIDELAGVSPAERRPLLESLGDQAADHIRDVLPRALERFEKVVLLTHVPPLREACWHEGHISDDEWSPHFTCLAMGQAILDVMREWPDRQLTVLCGHTHGSGETRPLKNVLILTGGAEYGDPAVQRLFEFE